MQIFSFKRIYALVLIGILLSSTWPAGAQTGNNSSTPQSREDLMSQIQERAKQLEVVDKQIQATRESLQSTAGARKSLQRELQTISGNISQLNLNLKADEINIQKLNLEVESLGYDLRDIAESIKAKKETIEKILLEFQKNDYQKNTLLMIFLKSESLADGVLAAQALKDLQDQLVMDMGSLRLIQDEYNDKLQTASTKKDSVAAHKRNLENRKLIVEDQKQERETLLKETKNKESEYAKQISALEKLQAQIANEIESLDAVLRTQIDPATLPTIAPGVLEWPIENGHKVITQGYGSTSFAAVTYKGKWHNGIDIGVPVGTPVKSAEDGTVVAVGNNDSYCPKAAYGRFIVVKHNNNLTTLYAHLSRQIVKVGQEVKRGETIGYAGKTGWATGPHLHFVVFAGPTFYMRPTKSCGPMPQGGDMNPMGYL